MIDFSSILSALGSAVAGGGFGWLLRSNRRKATAEADAAEFDSLRMAMEQIKDLQSELSEKSAKIRQLHDMVIDAAEERHNLEMRLLSSRCDRMECKCRRPPLPWMEKQSVDKNEVSPVNDSENEKD